MNRLGRRPQGTWHERVAQAVDRPLLQDVYEVLERAGFWIHDSRGLTIEPMPGAVRVHWCPDYTLLRPAINLGHNGRGDVPYGYGQGIKAIMAAAVTAVLEQAGYRVQAHDSELLVSTSGKAELSSPNTD